MGLCDDMLLIGFDESNNKDIPVLTVGRKTGNKMSLINVFTGKEASDLYAKLTTVKELFNHGGTYIWKHGSWITSETEKLRYRKEKRYDII